MVVDVGAKNDPNPANRKTEYIPGEFCEVVPGQLFSGRLSFTRSPEMTNLPAKLLQKMQRLLSRADVRYLD
jgi:hypothetical protein